MQRYNDRVPADFLFRMWAARAWCRKGYKCDFLEPFLSCKPDEQSVLPAAPNNLLDDTTFKKFRVFTEKKLLVDE